MNLLEFRKILNEEIPITEACLPLLEKMVEQYPAFTTAQILLCKAYKELHNLKFEAQKKRCVIHMEFREQLKTLLSNTSEVLEEQTNEGLDNDELMALIDPPSQYQLEGTSKNKVPFESLAKELFDIQNHKKEHRENQQVLISSFVSSFKSKVSRPNKRRNSILTEKPEKDSDGLISETLAKIYIKQELYDEAIHTYETLSLKYPKKNAYFAERIEEIKALHKKQ
ncbi:MAG: hypothetical protein ACPGSG_07165 [Prolixibacteraceae bacterium]